MEFKKWQKTLAQAAKEANEEGDKTAATVLLNILMISAVFETGIGELYWHLKLNYNEQFEEFKKNYKKH